jgi:putative OPT family oligopeptide transporter
MISASSRIPDHVRLPELTWRGIIIGILITVLFTASNVFLGLKVGLTFSSAIPAAVISMSVLRWFRDSNILENNMVQTQASAAGTLSSIIFILPALVMMGHWQGFPFWQTFAICAAGGVLGVMFTIPLRRAMVVQSDLPYPEGVAAAEILRVGTRAAAATGRADAPDCDTGITDIMAGSLVAAVVSLANNGLRVLGDNLSAWLTAGSAVLRIPMGFSLALLGAGYLIGMVAGAAMLTGLVIAWGIAIPVLTFMHPLPEAMSVAAYATSLWSSQVRFMGAGVIGVGAIWTLATLFVPVTRGLQASFSALGRRDNKHGVVPRTELDLSSKWIVMISLGMVAILVAAFRAFLSDAPISVSALWQWVGYGVFFSFVFGLLVAAACGYMAGLVGSSTSPISGIGIVAIVFVSLLILAIGGDHALSNLQGSNQFAIALAIFTTTAVVAVASISNDNLQDLKTGWLVGATPWRQQVALLIGCVAGAAIISPVLELLYNAYGFGDVLPRPGMDPTQALSAPQATLMLTIAQGIFTHQLNWTMIWIGVAVGIGLVVIDQCLKRRFRKARLPILAVGIGIYLPPTVSSPIVVGAVLAWGIGGILQRAVKAGALMPDMGSLLARRGVLLASGFIVGESLVGVLMAVLIEISGQEDPLALAGPSFATTASWLGLGVFFAVALGFGWRVLAPVFSDRQAP